MGTDSGQIPKMKWSAGHIHADDPDQMITEAAEFVTSKVSGLQVTEDGDVTDIPEEMKVLHWYHVVPVVNLIHDLAFDSTPTPEQIKDLLNTFGLIVALLFSMAIALPASFDFDEVQDAIARMSEEDTRYDGAYHALTEDRAFYEEGAWGWWLDCSKQISRCCCLLGSALLVIIATYVFVGSTSFKGPDGMFSPKLLYVYWRVIRIIIFYVMVVLGQGVVSLFSAIQGIYLMKFPDLYIEEHHKHPRFGNERYSPNAYFNSMALCMLLVSAIAMGLLMPSFALTFKNVMSHRMTCKLQSAADKAYRLNLKRLSSGTPLNRSTSKELQSLAIEAHLDRFGQIGLTCAPYFKEARIDPSQLPELSIDQMCSIGVPLGFALLLVKEIKEDLKERNDEVGSDDDEEKDDATELTNIDDIGV